MIMTEIEPIIENVQPGDTVTIERGAPGEPGHASFTLEIVSSPGEDMGVHEATLSYIQGIAESDLGYRITRIIRPTPPVPPIPDEPGVRFWARWRSVVVREYIVTDGDWIVDLTDGGSWERDLFERRHTVVPAPEPETVPVPADLIREAEEWSDSIMRLTGMGTGILTRIVLAVREREGES